MSDISDPVSTTHSGTAVQDEAPDPTPGAQPFAASVARLRAMAGRFAERFGLRENPFHDTVNLEYYFKSAAHEEAFLRLAATVRDGIALGLVTGPSGVGKTIVSQLLLQSLDRADARVVMVLVTPQMGRTALLREILREAGVTEMPTRFQDLLGLLESTMIDLHREGKRLVVIVDEAHFLSSEALHVLRTLSNLESPQQKLCTCLLFAGERFLRRTSATCRPGPTPGASVTASPNPAPDRVPERSCAAPRRALFAPRGAPRDGARSGCDGSARGASPWPRNRR
jgi:hypothetical protein